MPAPIRAFIVVLAITAAFFAGALYFGAHGGFGAASDTGAPSLAQQVASLTYNFGNRSAADDELIQTIYHLVDRAYYRDVNPQILVKGERTALLAYLNDALKKKNIRAALPQATAGGGESQAVAALESQLAYAQTHYAPLGVAASDLTQAALAGMLKPLDPYTEYLTPQAIGALNETLNGGDFGGIGVFIYQLKNGGVLLQPIPDLPAARAGMRGGEIVETIDGHQIRGFPIERVEKMIRGDEGTQVLLKTHPYKGTVAHTFSITREIIHVPTVNAKMEGNYDYIRLSDFGQTSAAEIRKALVAGKAKGAKGYILDLRFNGGGLLDAAVDISSLFVPHGTIVTEIDRAGDRDTKTANGSYIDGVRPLVVLVNGFTASSSEITAGALQDYKLATLIGTKTYGKGVVQGIYTMPNGGALKITTQRYLTPAGRDIQHKGIVPDQTVTQKLDFRLVDTPADKQLQAAKAYLDRFTR
ncbi:MAG TPA: S41 family peptidase [Candidatus Rubrimentiphilum sp.]|nr:S41 family peptidase [Candidatus Rubrimentiphilum sp.]